MRNPLSLIAFAAVAVTAAVVGCSSSPPDSGANLPKRTDNEEDAAVPSGYDCTNRDAVDERPACDQCARDKCCEWIVKCDDSPQCKAAQKCIAGCADGDAVCIYTCAATSGSGGEILNELGACLTNECSAECPAPDAGFADFEF